LVKSFARPSGQFEEVVVDYINTKRYFQGKFSLNTIELVMYDPIDPSAAQKMWAWLNLCYEQISGRAGYKEMAVARGLRLKLLDPPGSVIEQYDFINALPMNFNFNTLDYGSGESLMCNVTLRYDAYIMQY
ncbi:MAG: hypothetical protein ABIP51_13140, partial [Bacteroidia bacterium]